MARWLLSVPTLILLGCAQQIFPPDGLGGQTQGEERLGERIVLAAADPERSPGDSGAGEKATGEVRESAARGCERGRWEGSVSVVGSYAGAPDAGGKTLVYLPSCYDHDADSRRWPLVIALHGWGHTPELYRKLGALDRWAEDLGVVMAVPAMGKTVYESAYYPESRNVWGKVPGSRWVGEVLLPFMRSHYRVSSDRRQTAIVGYSTGGRGALLIAQAYPEIGFAGSLSGTYDLFILPVRSGEYRIHAAVYGPRERFAQRWRSDNVVEPSRIERLEGTRVFASHASNDPVVDADQLAALQRALANRADTAQLRFVPGGHDWAFWQREGAHLFESLRTWLRGGDGGPSLRHDQQTSAVP